MEQMNVYMFTENGQTKAVIVATNVDIAIHKMQQFLDERNEAEDYFQKVVLEPSFSGIGDWEVLVYENYKIGGEQQTLTKNAVAMRYELFELPFAFNKVYGAIGIF